MVRTPFRQPSRSFNRDPNMIPILSPSKEFGPWLKRAIKFAGGQLLCELPGPELLCSQRSLKPRLFSGVLL